MIHHLATALLRNFVFRDVVQPEARHEVRTRGITQLQLQLYLQQQAPLLLLSRQPQATTTNLSDVFSFDTLPGRQIYYVCHILSTADYFE